MKILFRVGCILVLIAVILVFIVIGIKLADNDKVQNIQDINSGIETEVMPDQSEKIEKNMADRYTDAVKNNMAVVSGDCQWGYKIYSSGIDFKSASFKAPSASVIKVFIMEYAYDLIEKGELSLDDIMSGSSVRNLMNAMITKSDNSATNVFINNFGMDKMNAFFAEKGYSDTKIERRMLDTQAMQAGRDNYTSVDDVMKFLDKLYENQDIYPYDDMLSIMKQQQVRTKIPRLLPSGIVVANKTGELSNVENDIGIIFGNQNDIALVFMCSNLSSTSTARDAISNSAYDLYSLVNEY